MAFRVYELADEELHLVHYPYSTHHLLLLYLTMSTPVVVQGTAVAAPAQQQHHVGGGGATETEHQPAKTGCNDPIFALLFYGNLGAILAVAAIYGPGSFDTSTSNSSFDYSG